MPVAAGYGREPVEFISDADIVQCHVAGCGEAVEHILAGDRACTLPKFTGSHQIQAGLAVDPDSVVFILNRLPDGGVAVTVAGLSTCPASTSDWVSS